MENLMKLLYKKTKRINPNYKKYLSGKFVTLKKIHPYKTILLSGSGRSGTTWLANIITASHGFGYIFEPFDHRKVKEAKHLPLRTYMRPEENYPERAEFVKRVLSGKIHNSWTDRDNKNFFVWKYLVKSIRANLMLAWIDRNFHCPIIYLIRHPCAVVLSKIKSNWDTHLEIFLEQNELMRDYLNGFKKIIRAAKNPLQKHTVMWCIENLIPLDQFKRYNWIICTYEGLCNNKEKEVDRIFARLGLKRTKQVNSAINNFYQTRKDSAVRVGKNPVCDWKNQLSKKDVADILGIVDDFGIKLYGENPMPRTEHLQKFEI
jgi:hypothetical protein